MHRQGMADRRGRQAWPTGVADSLLHNSTLNAMTQYITIISYKQMSENVA